MNGETWLILGATSAIARAFARRAAASGAAVLLAGRDPEDLARQAADITLRHGVAATPLRFEARDIRSHPGFAADCEARAAGSVLNVFLAFGIMPEQAAADADPAVAAGLVEANFTGAATVLAALGPALVAQGRGVVLALGSVAGDRGRPRHFLYGATKAALLTYLQGFGARMAKHGVRVIALRAGPVDTGMTWSHGRMPFLITPERFAAAAWARAAGPTGTAYIPRIWQPVMAVIRALPTPVFNRLDF